MGDKRQNVQENHNETVDLEDKKSNAAEDEKSNLFTATFTVINSMMGSAIIGLPYSMRQAGLPFGILLLIVVAYVTDYSIILLIKGGNLSGTNTYQCLVNKAFGLTGYVILSILQFLYPFITMISYNIIAGDTLTKVLQQIPGVGPENILAERHFVIAMTTLVFMLPLSMYRNIANLGKISFVSLVLTLAIVVIVVVEAATLGPNIPPSEGAWNFAQSNAMQAVGIMAFAFVSHHSTFLIYGSLETPTINNWSCVSHISVLFSLIIYLIFAGSAYGTFTGYTQGDLFENYCKNDAWATIGRLLYGLTTILTYPIECFVIREKGDPLTAVVQVQSKALFLGGHDYKIEFKGTVSAGMNLPRS
ncbi:putative sodium-coupled neutral amino acid transporter 11 isoform X4 [Mobula hypostoma]|uniref:putative sodium-coupled neutral amino acid transporter 11 isoform X4 n=1 Tax=Mobula hypostoma TaxID=723540 RepID=UPI002FC2DAF1